MKYKDCNTLEITQRANILCVTLNQPDKLNAISPEMEEELLQVFENLRRDRSVDVVVLTGAGRVFSAGGDLSRHAALAADLKMVKQEFELARRFIHTLLDVEQPIICRLNGDAIGLGATLALY